MENSRSVRNNINGTIQFVNLDKKAELYIAWLIISTISGVGSSVGILISLDKKTSLQKYVLPIDKVVLS